MPDTKSCCASLRVGMMLCAFRSDAGLAELEDPETGELVLVDTSDRSVRAAFAEKAAEEEATLLRFFNRSGIDHVELSTDKPYINAVRALFQRRARKR